VRAVLGLTALPVTPTGLVVSEPASAMALFDEDGKVVHQVP